MIEKKRGQLKKMKNSDLDEICENEGIIKKPKSKEEKIDEILKNIFNGSGDIIDDIYSFASENSQNTNEFYRNNFSQHFKQGNQSEKIEDWKYKYFWEIFDSYLMNVVFHATKPFLPHQKMNQHEFISIIKLIICLIYQKYPVKNKKCYLFIIDLFDGILNDLQIVFTDMFTRFYTSDYFHQMKTSKRKRNNYL